MATRTNREFAVVTGASTGIGFELAKQCIENDFDVLVCADEPSITEAAMRLLMNEVLPETVKAAQAGKQTAPGSAKPRSSAKETP